MRKMSTSLISRLTLRPDKGGTKASLLLVDDEANILEYMKKGLNANKYHVLTAANGAEALDISCHQKVDLVVTDVMMPIMGGFELMNRIWDDAAIAQTPIILLYARAPDGKWQREELAKLSEGHCIRFLSKPFSRKALITLIEELLHLNCQLS